MDAATKAYVDAAVTPRFSECYLLAAEANIACSPGYSPLVTSSGTGCAITAGREGHTTISLGFLRVWLPASGVRCDGTAAPAGVRYECLRWSPLGVGGEVLAARCKGVPVAGALVASTVAVCCR
jgi:hypothetical protein